MFFIFHNIWYNLSHWLIFFKIVKTTNQTIISDNGHLILPKMINYMSTLSTCHQMGVSENVVYPIVPNGFADHYPVFKNGYFIGNINPTFSIKPIFRHLLIIIPIKWL